MYISSDTNIWIDFYSLGHPDHPFRLDHDFYISRDTFEEELLCPKQMREELPEYGLKLTDVSDDEYFTALQMRSAYPALSIYDCFALAIAKLRTWILLTGDMPLRKAAAKEGIECHGTIWIYDQLKAQGKMTESEYDSVMDEMILAVERGFCRFPLAELRKRKKP